MQFLPVLNFWGLWSTKYNISAASHMHEFKMHFTAKVIDTIFNSKTESGKILKNEKKEKMAENCFWKLLETFVYFT